MLVTNISKQMCAFHRISKKVISVEGTCSDKDFTERRNFMNAENSILLKLTEILEKENLINVEERNRMIYLIEKGEIT